MKSNIQNTMNLEAKKEILIEKIELVNQYISGEKDKVNCGKEILSFDAARAFKNAKSSNAREKAIRSFVDMVSMIYGNDMRFIIKNTIFVWTKHGDLKPIFRNGLNRHNNTGYFEVENPKDVVPTDMERYEIFNLLNYGIDDKIYSLIIKNTKLHYTDVLYKEIIQNKSRELKKVQGIGNGVIRKLKKSLIRLYNDIDK